MKLATLFRRRTIWLPTRWGILLLVVGCSMAGVILWVWAEPFLSVTSRIPADVLVVEGWMGVEGLEAAADEFRNGSYRWVVAAGSFNSTQQYSFAEVAQRQLRRSGIPREQIILAKVPNVSKQRTYSSAAAVRMALEDARIQPQGVNIFTRGPHARRSWVVYGKAMDCPVGVIGWIPSRDRNVAWWDSSDRMRDLLSEGCGYLFERVLNSGRWTNRPPIASGAAPRPAGDVASP